MATNEASFKRTWGLPTRAELYVAHSRTVSMKYPTMQEMMVLNLRDRPKILTERFDNFLSHHLAVFEDETQAKFGHAMFAYHAAVTGDRLEVAPQSLNETSPLVQEKWLDVQLFALTFAPSQVGELTIHYGRGDGMPYECEVRIALGAGFVAGPGERMPNGIVGR
jgi:hypothetical protein